MEMKRACRSYAAAEIWRAFQPLFRVTIFPGRRCKLNQTEM